MGEYLTTDFEKDKQFSQSNDKIKQTYPIISKHFSIKELISEELKNSRTSDVKIKLTDDTIKNIEIKCYRLKQNDSIVLEKYSDKKRNVLGWTYFLKENKTDYVLFVWEGDDPDYIILKAKELQEFWEQNNTQYKENLNSPSTKDGSEWQSSYSWIPIEDIPSDIIYAKYFKSVDK